MDLPYDLPKTWDFPPVKFRLFKPNHSIPVGSVLSSSKSMAATPTMATPSAPSALLRLGPSQGAERREGRVDFLGVGWMGMVEIFSGWNGWIFGLVEWEILENGGHVVTFLEVKMLLFQDMNHVEITCWGWREILYLGHLVVFWQNRHCLQNIYQPTQPRFSKIWIDHCPKLPMHLN